MSATEHATGHASGHVTADPAERVPGAARGTAADPGPALAGVSAAPLDASAIEASVVTARCGAALTFTGVVRDHDPEADGTVTALEYTSHPDAGAILDGIVARHARGPGHPDGEVRVAAVHRTGPLAVGDLALVVSVASAHRAEAFEACRAVVEDIKAEVPIWKRQHTASGAPHWVGLP
ncbi:molybdenum cofactor biosynthesis protein MoaE [Citricoccus sp. SGAir0253]|uniref:molybdenum cofactor biosynthesis protein MoaE n=1 Tax=Citricoccus sp. SGAir0253 TaxID=2567881 RepID=UPI0010CD24A9|nr:molybdenum cofactor biosynthesis protein MoaE [Citricoccus sp. SGAir0253]QCU78290.1 molybdenum cofactor biosynthesis protein MoaE [Citricoccus sp. SGAir0253]